jgi:hypothetical protein
MNESKDNKNQSQYSFITKTFLVLATAGVISVFSGISYRINHFIKFEYDSNKINYLDTYKKSSEIIISHQKIIDLNLINEQSKNNIEKIITEETIKKYAPQEKMNAQRNYGANVNFAYITLGGILMTMVGLVGTIISCSYESSENQRKLESKI